MGLPVTHTTYHRASGERLNYASLREGGNFNALHFISVARLIYSTKYIRHGDVPVGLEDPVDSRFPDNLTAICYVQCSLTPQET